MKNTDIARKVLEISEAERQQRRIDLSRPHADRSFWEWFRFLALHVAFGVPGAGVYILACAEGLRSMFTLFEMKLYAVPFPRFRDIASYQGWNRLDIAHVVAAILIFALAYAWFWIIKHLAGNGNAIAERQLSPAFFYFKALIVSLLVGIEAWIFFVGLGAWGTAMWSEHSSIYTAGITTIYVAGMALVAMFHNSFHYGE